MTNSFRATVDLWATVVWATVAVVVVAGVGIESTALRVALLLPLVLVLPGHAFVSVLYPDTEVSSGRTATSGVWWHSPALESVERIALSVGTSLALVALLAFGLNFMPYPLRADTLVLLVGGVTATLALLATFVRLAVPPEQRFSPAVAVRPGRVYRRYFRPNTSGLALPGPLASTSQTGVLANVVLVCSVLILAGSVGYAATVSPSDQTFTEFSLVPPDDSAGADSIPREFDGGSSNTLTLAIGNHEGYVVRYTTVIRYEGRTVDRFQTTVGAGETRHVRRTIELDGGGDGRQLLFLLYRGDPPADPHPETAYRVLRLTVNGGDTPVDGDDPTATTDAGSTPTPDATRTPTAEAGA